MPARCQKPSGVSHVHTGKVYLSDRGQPTWPTLYHICSEDMLKAAGIQPDQI